MQVFALAAVAIYCGVSLFMAVRLIGLARRTHELPELMIGLAFLAGAVLGYTFNVAAGILLATGRPAIAQLSFAAGQIGMAAGAFFIFVSWHEIFAPRIRGGRWLMLAAFAVLAGTVVATIVLTGPVTAVRLQVPAYWILLVAQGACYAVTGAASYHAASMARRRSALGLSDPVVANRLLLWGVSNTAITISYAYSLVAGILLRLDLPSIYTPAVVSSLGLTSACCITLAFFPPRAYMDWIRRRAVARASSQA